MLDEQPQITRVSLPETAAGDKYRTVYRLTFLRDDVDYSRRDGRGSVDSRDYAVTVEPIGPPGSGTWVIVNRYRFLGADQDTWHRLGDDFAERAERWPLDTALELARHHARLLANDVTLTQPTPASDPDGYSAEMSAMDAAVASMVVLRDALRTGDHATIRKFKEALDVYGKTGQLPI